jgi:hypothetical protein
VANYERAGGGSYVLLFLPSYLLTFSDSGHAGSGQTPSPSATADLFPRRAAAWLGPGRRSIPARRSRAGMPDLHDWPPCQTGAIRVVSRRGYFAAVEPRDNC